VVVEYDEMKMIPEVEPGLARDVALVCLADALVGVAFGAITVGAGLPVWLPVLLSLVVFAGAAQFLFVGVAAVGGGLVGAVAAALLVNLRLVPLGVAAGDVLATSWRKRLLGSHLLVDETVAFVLTKSTPSSRRAAYWACGSALFVSWNIGVLVGAFGGAVVEDTNAMGLDAAFPVVLLALMIPALADRSTRHGAALGAAVALMAALFLPAGLPVLLSLVGVIALLRTNDRNAAAPA
jgi:4-azaleucine resistance transporter AzlC